MYRVSGLFADVGYHYFSFGSLFGADVRCSAVTAQIRTDVIPPRKTVAFKTEEFVRNQGHMYVNTQEIAVSIWSFFFSQSIIRMFPLS